MRTKLGLGVVSSMFGLLACGGGGGSADAPVAVDSPPGTPDMRIIADADPFAPDARPGFTCNGQPIPTTAPATLIVAGNVGELSTGGTALQTGVAIQGFRTGNGTPVATATSGAMGAYSISIPNPGMTPVEGYLFATPGSICGSGQNMPCKNVYLFPPTNIFADIPMAPVRTVSDSTLGLLSTVTQGNQQPTLGVVALVVTDCDGSPLQGATVSSDAVGVGVAVKYNAGGFPSSSATMTDVDGVAYIFNVPPGNVTVDAMYQGMDFREHTLQARAADGVDNAINTTTIQP